MEEGSKMLFSRPVSEIIKERISVRTFQKEKLSTEIKSVVTDYFSKLLGPFQVKIRFALLDMVEEKEEGLRLGSYGVIKGASSFLTAAVEKKPYSMEQLGYQMEWLILFITSLGIGTCWMAGTFNRGSFVKALNAGKHELVPVAVPVGFPAQNRSMVDTVMHSAAGSTKRKVWAELFFMDSFENPLDSINAGSYSLPLEMVRLAPSASNKQPWRVLYKDRNFHFYLKHTPFYDRIFGFDIQKIDIGIAMFHFEAAAREAGLKGRWEIVKPDVPSIPDRLEYIISWVTC